MSTHEETPTPPEDRRTSPDRSITSLLSDLMQEVTVLMRQELQLAKLEISQKVSQVETGISALAVGAALALSGFIIVLHAGIYGVADLLSAELDLSVFWIASLIVGGVILIIGVVALLKGQSSLKAKNLTPQRTARSLRQEEDWTGEEEADGKRSLYDEGY